MFREYLDSRAGKWLLRDVERTLFGCVAAVLVTAGFVVLLYSSATFLARMLTEPHRIIEESGRLLDGALLVVMLSQLVYALALKVGGAPLGAQPFLIVAIVAIVRRILDVAHSGAYGAVGTQVEIVVLAVAAFVCGSAIALLRRNVACAPGVRNDGT